jgi:hypothetical protein
VLQSQKLSRSDWDATISKRTDPFALESVRQFHQGRSAQPVPQASLDTQVAESPAVPARVWAVYPAVGHASHWEVPEPFAVDVVALLQDLAGPGGAQVCEGLP